MGEVPLHLTVPFHKEVFFKNGAVLSGWGIVTDIKQFKESNLIAKF